MKHLKDSIDVFLVKTTISDYLLPQPKEFSFNTTSFQLILSPLFLTKKNPHRQRTLLLFLAQLRLTHKLLNDFELHQINLTFIFYTQTQYAIPIDTHSCAARG